MSANKRTRHGRSNAKIYGIWEFMNQRCYDAKHCAFKWYGARGIKVCERWRGVNGFANFFADMGERPEGKSLDRIDNNGNYEPGNCRWATHTEQMRNRRNVRMITYQGQTKPLFEWAEEYGLTPNALRLRLLKCDSFEKCLASPLQVNKRRTKLAK